MIQEYIAWKLGRYDMHTIIEIKSPTTSCEVVVDTMPCALCVAVFIYCIMTYYYKITAHSIEGFLVDIRMLNVAQIDMGQKLHNTVPSPGINWSTTDVYISWINYMNFTTLYDNKIFWSRISLDPINSHSPFDFTVLIFGTRCRTFRYCEAG